MLDSLLDLFERDKKSSSARSGGLRSKLANAIDGERDEYRSDTRHYDDRNRKRDDDDDRQDDDDRPSKRKKKREFDFLDFGD